MDTKKPYDHLYNDSEKYYYPIQLCLSRCWKATTPEFKKAWEKLHIRWFEDNFMFEDHLVNAKQLFCRLVFGSCAVLSIDQQNLTPTNWLPCVVTLRDLNDILDMSYYGLTEEELNEKIFEHSTEEDNEDCEEDDTILVIRNINGVTIFTDIPNDKKKNELIYP